MKKLLLMGLFFAGFSTYAQDKAVAQDAPKSTWTCETATFNKEQNVMILSGDVSFTTDVIKINSADEIVYNLSTKQIVATNVQQFEIKGSLQVTDGGKDTLTYKLGEDIAYMN